MSTKHSKKEHLEAAASHHEQAARYHHGASRHFEAGKDFAHAAHEAMLAHGHGLHAIDRAHDAGAHGATAPPGAAALTGPAASHPSPAAHHAMAAQLHEEAAHHMRHAVKHFDDDRGGVAHEAQLALTLALRALSHGNEAAKLFVKATPVAGA